MQLGVQMTTLQFTNFSLFPDPLFFCASSNVDFKKIHLLNKKAIKQKHVFFFFRVELIVIQLGAFVKVSSVPEATISSAKAYSSE